MKENCSDCKNDITCSAHNLTDIKNRIEKFLQSFKEFKQVNLISYTTFIWQQNENDSNIYLVRDFVYGSNMKSITKSNGWTYSLLRLITSGVLDAIEYLHEAEIQHGNINELSVFIDKSGVGKIADYFLNPYLNRLAYGITSRYITEEEEDLPDIGKLIEPLGFTSGKIIDFIRECKSKVNLNRLKNHPFIQDISTSSRLDDEFEVLMKLGSGAFGDVLKVRNYIDGQLWAIKRIKMINSDDIKRTQLEVETLSKLEHDNIVRYKHSWSESVDKLFFRKNESLKSMDVDAESGIGSSDQMDISYDANQMDIPYASKRSRNIP